MVLSFVRYSFLRIIERTKKINLENMSSSFISCLSGTFAIFFFFAFYFENNVGEEVIPNT